MCLNIFQYSNLGKKGLIQYFILIETNKNMDIYIRNVGIFL